mgnify:FL=1|jgi:MoaA/NifB/PqqE/SkfB family radical SAM enzyme
MIVRNKPMIHPHLCDDKGNIIELPSPHPVPDQATYDRVRQEALDFSEKRRLNYEKYQLSSNREEMPNYMPIRIDIENVSRCNFNCSMCIVSTWDGRKRADDMSLQDFKKLIDQQYGLVEIKIQGMGEPTIQRDDFFEMIKYARLKKIWVRVVTNASLLHLRDNYKKLIDSDVNEIQISIDGATKEVFESIRTGSVFSRVVDNCKKINSYAISKGIERTKMWTVVQRKNQHQIKEIIDLGKEMGFVHMAFSLNMIDFGVDEIYVKNSLQSVETTFTNKQALEYINYGESLGLNVRFWRQTKKYSMLSSIDQRCPWPFERGFVSSDMRIVPCCIIGNPEVADLGDAKEFTHEWESEKWRQFRRSHIDGIVPKYCKNCYQD